MRTVLMKHYGFTAIEVLIAIGLMAATAGITVPMYRQYQVYADLDTAVTHLVQATHTAQTLSQAGKFDSIWGVYFPTGTLFAGTSFAERDAEKDVSFPLPSSIDTDGLSEVIFERVQGLPSATGEICVYSTITDGFRTITIDTNGVLTASIIQHGGCHPSEGYSSSSETSSSSSSSSDSSNSSEGSSSDSSSSTSSESGGSSSSSEGSSSDSSSSTSSESGGSSSSSSSSSISSSSNSEVNDNDDDIEDQDDEEHGDGDDDNDDDDNGNGGGGTIPCEVRFKLKKNGNKLISAGTNDVKIKVIGSAITYGAGGPKVDVRVAASTDGGSAWSDLFGGKAVKSAEQQTLENLPDGSSLVLRFNGRYSWLFNKTYRSDANDGHIFALRNGDAIPQYKAFANQESLESFLKNYIDKQGKIKIGPKDVIFLVELGSLSTQSSDFQDAVILVTFTEKATTCTSKDKARLKLSFRRIANTGKGDVKERVYVGPNALAFRKNQWIPLKDKSGNIIIDNGIVEDVKGIAVERGNGWVRIIQHGSHPNSSGKEIVDLKARFRGSWISSIVNEIDQNKSENPTDGIINDNDDGDEFVPGKTKKSMFFFTRTVATDDGVILYWTEVRPDGANASSASSSSSESVPTVMTDPCAIPYTLSPSGSLAIHKNADLTVRVIGSESTFGENGPRISVRGKISLNDGGDWQELYGYRSVRGGELSVFKNVASGSQILLSFNGRYSWVYNRTVDSGSNDPHIKVLQKGQTAIGVRTLKENGQMKKFLSDLVNTNGTMKIGVNEVSYLLEFNDISRPNFKDAVVVISIDRPADSPACGTVSSSSSSADTSSSVSSSSVSGSVDTDNDGVLNKDDWCPFSTVMPEPVPTEYISFKRLALTQPRGNVKKVPIFRSGPRKQVSAYSLADTHGCSCTQILDAIDHKGYNLFEDHPALFRRMKNLFKFYLDSSRKFGCSESLIKMVSEGE